MTHETQAGRPEPDDEDDGLAYFPEHRILHARTGGDAVAVAHRGEVTVYPDPQALAAALFAHDPATKERLDLVDEAALRARSLAEAAIRLSDRAMADATAAQALGARASRQMLRFWLSLAAAGALAILVLGVRA